MALLAGCSRSPSQSADVSEGVRNSLKEAGLASVSATEDREKGVVTLNGHVRTEADKARAASLAQAIAVNQVVANQIGVIPEGEQSSARTENADFDKAIEKNLDGVLLQEKLNKDVQYRVKNHNVTLTGHVDSEDKRARAETVAAGVPDVAQVVNELQIKNRKATSSN